MKGLIYQKCKDYIRSDYFRVKGVKTNSIIKLFSATFLDIGLRFLFWFRLSWCDNKLIQWPARLFYMHLRMKHHIEIDRNTNIGYGCRIVHGGPIVINSTTIIGDNVDLYQYTTIGSMYMRAATIGNNVYIGPSVCIVENVHIGDGVTIGAGAVVVKDVMGGVTIAGNPAKEISHKEPGRLVWRKWNREWNKVK